MFSCQSIWIVVFLIFKCEAKPKWSPVFGSMIFNSTEELKTFKSKLDAVHNELLNGTYNSATSLIRFYHDFKQNEHRYKGNLEKFYLDYQPLVHEEHMNCVGMTIKLKKLLVDALKTEYPQIDKYLFYSAGEMLLSSKNKILTRENLRGDEQWKHVALAMKFQLKNRSGCFFLDQSFGVPVVTLMFDKQHPHEEIFSEKSKYSKDYYIYELTQNGFINFTRKELAFLATKPRISFGAFYVGQAYKSILSLTEKRAIIKQKRSIVRRNDQMNRLLDTDVLLNNNSAVIEVFRHGKYFPVVRCYKLDLTNVSVHEENMGLPEERLEDIEKWNKIYDFPKGKFKEMIRNLSILSQDKNFISQLRILDDNINNFRHKFFDELPEYSDSDSNGDDLVYDTFVNYIHNLSSSEVLAMAEYYKKNTIPSTTIDENKALQTTTVQIHIPKF